MNSFLNFFFFFKISIHNKIEITYRNYRVLYTILVGLFQTQKGRKLKYAKPEFGGKKKM